jgi:hypothetical protein
MTRQSCNCSMPPHSRKWHDRRPRESITAVLSQSPGLPMGHTFWPQEGGRWRDKGRSGAGPLETGRTTRMLRCQTIRSWASLLCPTGACSLGRKIRRGGSLGPTARCSGKWPACSQISETRMTRSECRQTVAGSDSDISHGAKTPALSTSSIAWPRRIELAGGSHRCARPQDRAMEAQI